MVESDHIKPLLESHVLIAGLARDCGSDLVLRLQILSRAFARFRRVSFFVVESDSSDNTLNRLYHATACIPEFRFVSLGNLASKHPLRTDRIAICRNVYLEELRSSPCYVDVDYLAVADLDGVNDSLTIQAVESCWTIPHWDVCCANQYRRYYDIWALRHPLWCPSDCWRQYTYLRERNYDEFSASYVSVLSKMLHIDSSSEPIRVNSAFGGLAIYNVLSIGSSMYRGLDSRGREVCEHVFFHEYMSQNGSKILINPRLLNCRYDSRTKNAFPLGLLLYFLRCRIRQFIRAFN